jgi:hypothetical protein
MKVCVLAELIVETSQFPRNKQGGVSLVDVTRCSAAISAVHYHGALTGLEKALSQIKKKIFMVSRTHH